MWKQWKAQLFKYVSSQSPWKRDKTQVLDLVALKMLLKATLCKFPEPQGEPVLLENKRKYNFSKMFWLGPQYNWTRNNFLEMLRFGFIRNWQNATFWKCSDSFGVTCEMLLLCMPWWADLPTLANGQISQQWLIKTCTFKLIFFKSLPSLDLQSSGHKLHTERGSLFRNLRRWLSCLKAACLCSELRRRTYLTQI